jgi:hypothetical protein
LKRGGNEWQQPEVAVKAAGEVDGSEHLQLHVRFPFKDKSTVLIAF